MLSCNAPIGGILNVHSAQHGDVLPVRSTGKHSKMTLAVFSSRMLTLMVLYLIVLLNAQLNGVLPYCSAAKH